MVYFEIGIEIKKAIFLVLLRFAESKGLYFRKQCYHTLVDSSNFLLLHWRQKNLLSETVANNLIVVALH